MSQFFKEFNINYYLNGGINNPDNPSTYMTESPDIVFQNPSRTGYTFEGWFTNPSFKIPILGFSPSQESARNDLITEIQVAYQGIGILAVGTEFSTSNTFFYTWGYATYQRFGYNAPTTVVNIPYRQNFDKQVALFLGARTLHYLSSGELYGIGRNNYGMLSVGNTTDPTDYVLATETKNGSGHLNFTITKHRDFKVGAVASAIIDSNGDLYLSGFCGLVGFFGDGSTNDLLSYTKITSINKLKKIFSISLHALTVQKEDGTVWTIGLRSVIGNVLERYSHLLNQDILNQSDMFYWREIKWLKEVEELNFHMGASTSISSENFSGHNRVSLMAKFKDRFIVYGTNEHNFFGIPNSSDQDFYSPIDISHILPELFNYNDNVNTGLINLISSFNRPPHEILTILPANPKTHKLEYFPLLTINYNNSDTSLDYYNLETKQKINSIIVKNHYINELSSENSGNLKFIIKDNNRVIVFGGSQQYNLFTFELREKSKIESYPLTHNILYSPIVDSDHTIKSNKKITIGINSLENERDIVPKSFYIKKSSKSEVLQNKVPTVRDKRDYIYDTKTLSRFPNLSNKFVDIPFEYIQGTFDYTSYIGKVFSNTNDLSLSIQQLLNGTVNDISMKVISLDPNTIKIMNIDHIEYPTESLLIRDIGNRLIEINRENKIIYPYLPHVFKEFTKLETSHVKSELIVGLYYNFLTSTINVTNSIHNIDIDRPLSNEVLDNLDRQLSNILNVDQYSRVITNTVTHEIIKDSYRNGALILGNDSFYN